MLEPLPWLIIVMKDAVGVTIISTRFAGKMMVWDYSYQVKANHKDLLKVGQVTR